MLAGAALGTGLLGLGEDALCSIALEHVAPHTVLRARLLRPGPGCTLHHYRFARFNQAYQCTCKLLWYSSSAFVHAGAMQRITSGLLVLCAVLLHAVAQSDQDASLCGNWQAEYINTHQQIIQGHAPPRYAIAVSTYQGGTHSAVGNGIRDELCDGWCLWNTVPCALAGFSDRLLGIIGVFYYALLTGRAFQVHVPSLHNSVRIPAMHLALCLRQALLTPTYLHRYPRECTPTSWAWRACMHSRA